MVVHKAQTVPKRGAAPSVMRNKRDCADRFVETLSSYRRRRDS
jgi:hypothetical protein